MANTVYIFNCGINPISSITVNGYGVTTGVPEAPWTSGVEASPAVLTPITIPLNGNGTGTPSSAALVAGNTNSISITSQQVVYQPGVIDLTSYTMQSVDNMAMFVFFGLGSTFGQQPGGGALCQIVLTDTFGEFTQAFFVKGQTLKV